MLFIKQLAIFAFVAQVSAGGYATGGGIQPPRSYTPRSRSYNSASYSGFEQQKIEQEPIEQQPQQQQQQQHHQFDSQAEELNNEEDSVAQQGNYASYRAGYSANYGARYAPASNQPTTTPAPKDFGEIIPDELPAQELLAPAPFQQPKPRKVKLQLFPTEQKPQSSEPDATGEEQSQFVDFQHIKYGEIPDSRPRNYAPRTRNYAGAAQAAPISASYGDHQQETGYAGFAPKPKKNQQMGYNSYSDDFSYAPMFNKKNKNMNAYSGETIKAAVQTHQTVEYREVPIEQQEIKPIMIEIPASENTVSLHFKSRSSTLNIRQKHEPAKGQLQETQSEDEPQILRHTVTKPIYQEIREIIKPMRKITQEIRPVKEEIQTIVARSNKDKSKKAQSNNNHYAGQSVTEQPIQEENIEQQVQEQAHYDSGVLQEVTAFSAGPSTESSIGGFSTETDLTGFGDELGSTEASIASSKPTHYGHSYNNQKSYASHAAQSPSSGYSVKGNNHGSSQQAVDVPRKSSVTGGSVPFSRMTFTMGAAAKKQNNFMSAFATGGVLPPKPAKSRNPFRRNSHSSPIGRSAAVFENPEEENNSHDHEAELAVTPAPRHRFVPSAAPGSSDHAIIEDELENAELNVPLPESLQSAASSRSYRRYSQLLKSARRPSRQARSNTRRSVYRSSIN